MQGRCALQVRTAVLAATLVGALLAVGGCAKQAVLGQQGVSQMGSPPPAQTLPAHATRAASPAPTGASGASGKTKVTVYINVSSGCQAETTDLLNNLGMDYADIVDMEIVDFGSPDGEERWKSDGMDCMAILFNGSPAVKFPDKDGQPKTVAFFMPVGFSWEHEDLQQAFAALRAGKLQTLTEEEARRELGRKAIDVKVSVKESAGAAELQVNGVPVFVVRTALSGADGKQTPAQRANSAKAALEKWTASPIDPSALVLADEGGMTAIVADGAEIIRVSEADAKQAGKASTRGLADAWLKALRSSIVEAAREEAGKQQSKDGGN